MTVLIRTGPDSRLERTEVSCIDMPMRRGSTRTWLAMVAIAALVTLLGHHQLHDHAGGITPLGLLGSDVDSRFIYPCAACDLLMSLACEPGVPVIVPPPVGKTTPVVATVQSVYDQSLPRSHDPRGPPSSV